MSLGRMLAVATGVVAVALVAVALTGDERHQLRVDLPSANGLRSGSEVKVGGVPVGRIDEIRLREGDVVEATLSLDREKAGPVREDARVEIVTANLLGSKYMVLQPGRRGRELGGGARIPASRVTTPTDLDEVLSALDGDTRARLQVVLNELGVAVAGRKREFSRTLQLLPTDLRSARRLVDEVVHDNATLERLVQRSSSYVGTLAAERRQLTDALDGLGRTVEVTAGRRRELQATLGQAPGALRSAQRFLADLERTTRPLEPAARALADTAPALTATLAQLRPFERAARPAFDRAVAVSPTLTQLARAATPVLRQADPTLRSLVRAVEAAAPVSRTLDVSIDDVLGLVEGWARAIQGRDGLGHVFRGRATLSAEMLRTLVDSLGNPGTRRAERAARAPRREEPEPRRPEPPAEAAPEPAPARPEAPKDPVRGLTDALKDLLPADRLLDDVRGLLPDALGGTQGQRAPEGTDGTRRLLDLLLGP
ncbi:MlaD family protein [Conexibacter sp. SYSU D00693]|uniref:MlaD family protein n=1 Tax=Conexibacter sp. SYSU D00693 TaxID=2812560 RepID=UPI00196AB2B6|nr:MlaD family protein [Conexibacter sp. SYSU D00693]